MKMLQQHIICNWENSKLGAKYKLPMRQLQKKSPNFILIVLNTHPKQKVLSAQDMQDVHASKHPQYIRYMLNT